MLLNGKHLRVLEMEWAPFAVKSASAPLGWSGLDMDLLSSVSQKLNFTFDIIEEKGRSNETWSDTLIRTMQHGDLWASWWAANTQRIQYTSLLTPHIDTSPVLVVAPTEIGSNGDGYSQALVTFFLPFTWELWMALIAMVVASGVVDYILERSQGGTLGASIYEYMGGVMWGGFADPRTRVSAVYQVIGSFLIMIVVAAYTANLASAMTLSGLSKVAFGAQHLDLKGSRSQ